MTKGYEVRAQIDSENTRGLLLINGGAAVALLGFLPAIFGKPGLGSLVAATLWALGSFQLGLVFAVIHNRARRICSLVREEHQFRPSRCRYLPTWVPWTKAEPCVCVRSMFYLRSSLVESGVCSERHNRRHLGNAR
jgi:hypothetical protein